MVTRMPLFGRDGEYPTRRQFEVFVSQPCKVPNQSPARVRLEPFYEETISAFRTRCDSVVGIIEPVGNLLARSLKSWAEEIIGLKIEFQEAWTDADLDQILVFIEERSYRPDWVVAR